MPGPSAPLRIATRRSRLAMWQAHHVSSLLVAAHPGLEVELVPTSTEGDRRTDVPLWQIGGKGVFASEVQAAVLDGRADLAVHSAKDLPAVTGEGLRLAAVPERGDARDALVGAHLDGLPRGGVVATGSARRRAQLAHRRPDLRFEELRGNMATRLEKSAAFDAIVVAAAAFERLDWSHHLREVLDVELMVPQVGQGALAVECGVDDDRTAGLLAAVEHAPSRRRLDAERGFLAELGGDCSLPAGAHARLDEDSVHLLATLSADVAGPTLFEEREGTDPEQLGRSVAASLRQRLEAATP